MVPIKILHGKAIVTKSALAASKSTSKEYMKPCPKEDATKDEIYLEFDKQWDETNRSSANVTWDNQPWLACQYV